MSRRNIALVWAMALVFALAPAVSMSFATPAGAFSRFLVHSHDHGAEDHVHHGHHHGHGHHHDHDGDHHHDGAVDDGPGDQGQDRLHVHYDASCPSVLMPEPMRDLQHRVADRVAIPPVDAKQGAPPDRELRPPISTL